MRLKACVLAVLVAVGVSFTVYQNTFWRSELALFERSVYFEPQVGRIRALLAKACFFSGKVDEAIWHYQKAGEIFTTYADRVRDTDKRNFYNGFLKGIHFDLAQCFLAKGRIALSTEEYERALALDPRDSVILSNMAMNAMMEGKVDRAVQVLQQALAIDPGNLQTLNNLGVCLMGRGDAAGAEAAWRKALAVDPGFLPARDNLRKMGLK